MTVKVLTKSGPVTLSIAVLKYRLLPALLVVAASFALAATVLGVSALRGSIETALVTSVEADVAQQPFSIQAGTDKARSAIKQTVELVPVLDSDGDLETGTARTSVSVRAVSDSRLHVGTILHGIYPSSPGQATVSKSVSEATGAVVGDEVTISRTDYPDHESTIVGITVDTADVLDATAVIVDPRVDGSNATVWLSATDPYSLTSLQSLMDARSITYRHTDSATQAAIATLPVSDATLRAFQWGLGALLLIALVGLLVVLAPIARRDVESLTTAGMSASTAWRVVGAVPLLAVLAGQLVGLGTVLGVLSAASEPISRSFGQYWLTVPWPIGTAVALVVLSAVAASMVRPAVLAGRRLGRSLPSATSRLSLGMLGSLAAIGVGVALLFAGFIGSQLKSPPDVLSLLAFPGGVAVLVGLPNLIARAVGRTRLPAVGAVQFRLQTGVALAAMAAAVVVLWSSGSAATATHDANAFERASGGSQQQASLMLTEVPAGAADLIASRFRELGGTQVRQYNLVDELAKQLRVTGTRLVGCMQSAGTLSPDAVPPECFPQKTSVPVAIVALSRTDGEEATADPGLVEGGEVGLLEFEAGEADASALAVTRASPDSSLGGNLPGLVVSQTSAVAERFGLKPSGTRLVGLMDFGDLSTEERARMRSVVAQAAPAAQVAESSNVGSYDAERGHANVVAMIGAVAAAVLLLTGGVGVVLGNRQTRRVLVDVGAAPTQRAVLVLTWVAVPFLLTIAAGLLAWLTASINGVAMDGSLGTYWLAPIATTLICCLALFIAMLRVPPGERE